MRKLTYTATPVLADQALAWGLVTELADDPLAVAMELVGGSTRMAQKAGVSSSVLRKWRAGGSEPSRVNLIKMAEAAGVRAGWLAFGEGPMNLEEDVSAYTHRQDDESGKAASPLDLASLEFALESVASAQEAVGIQLKASTHAKVVRMVYSSYEESGEWPGHVMVKQIIRMVTDISS